MKKERLLFCKKIGIRPPLDTERILEGRNSEVWLISSKEKKWILKAYHRSECDSRDRIGTEFNFLSFLHKHGTPNVPVPIGMDKRLNCGIYSFIGGKRPLKITGAHIRQAAKFIETINIFRGKRGSEVLPKASDACFSISQHIELVDIRMQRLKLKLKGENTPVARFLINELAPAWERLRKRIVSNIPKDDLGANIGKESWILSPSDFGFHNTLENDGILSFLDFEYAGWDDPAKLACDFICQPELPINKIHAKLFLADLMKWLPEKTGFQFRVKMLLPLHRLKWCCILLNEFLPGNLQRRIHAGNDDRNILSRQLKKTKNYFTENIQEESCLT